MAKNIEIKARLSDFAAVEAAARELSDAPREILLQEDIFFHTPRGRLKLRILALNRGQLIYYERPDQSGPKASEYYISETSDPAALRQVLSAAFGERGVVNKERRLYLVGRTRIHMDIVEGLGEYLELEVVLEDGEGNQDGERIASDLMNRLGVGQDSLIQGAYMDLLEEYGR